MQSSPKQLLSNNFNLLLRYVLSTHDRILGSELGYADFLTIVEFFERYINAFVAAKP